MKDPGFGGVPAGCDRADHPPAGTKQGAIRTPNETSATGSNLLRSTPTIIADVAGIWSLGRGCSTAGRCAIGDVLSGDEAREAFAEPDDPGELDTPTD